MKDINSPFGLRGKPWWLDAEERRLVRSIDTGPWTWRTWVCAIVPPLVCMPLGMLFGEWLVTR
jgi:hypothetical protein